MGMCKRRENNEGLYSQHTSLSTFSHNGECKSDQKTENVGSTTAKYWPNGIRASRQKPVNSRLFDFDQSIHSTPAKHCDQTTRKMSKFASTYKSVWP